MINDGGSRIREGGGVCGYVVLAGKAVAARGDKRSDASAPGGCKSNLTRSLPIVMRLTKKVALCLVNSTKRANRCARIIYYDEKRSVSSYHIVMELPRGV